MDDLIGRVIKNEGLVENGGAWERLRLPAIAEVNDPLGRAEGEALWPWRYPIEVLRDRESKMGPYSWAAMFQQNPVPAEGGIFKRAWFEPFIDIAPQIVSAARYWDLAMSEKTTADFTVGVKIGQAVDGHFYVLDVVRARIDWGDLVKFMADVILADGSDVVQGIEEKGYMSRAVQELNADARLHHHQIWGYPVDTDKVTRALPFAAKLAAGTVHVLNAHWTQAYVDELLSFPNAAYDDQVDASSGVWGMIGDELTVIDGAMQHGDDYRFSQSEY